MSDNLPPGVSESMIPGNRPQDIAAQRYMEGLDDDDLLEFFANEKEDVAGLVLYDDPGYAGSNWFLETPVHPQYLPEWPTGNHGELIFETHDDALAYLITFHDEDLQAEMADRYLEEPPEPDEPDWDNMPEQD